MIVAMKNKRMISILIILTKMGSKLNKDKRRNDHY